MRDPSARAREFEAKYDAYGSMVYRLAMVYLGSHADAEDVVQEAFMRLLYRAPQFTDAGHEKRWLIRVTVNLCRDQLKGFWKRRPWSWRTRAWPVSRSSSELPTPWCDYPRNIRPPFTCTTTRATPWRR